VSTPNPLAQPLPWNLVSADYAAEVVPNFERYAARALDACAIAAGEAVLDVASGPGTLAMLAARRGARVSAIDFSPAMIEQLGARAREASLAIDARVGDGMALPFDDASFDAGFSMFGLMFFPDRARGLAELRRTVRAGGRVAISSWKPFLSGTPQTLLIAGLMKQLPGLPFGEGKAPLGDPEQMRAELEGAGFADVEIQEVAFDERFDDFEALWGDATRTFPPMVLLRHKLGPEAWPRVHDGVRAQLVAALGDGPYVQPMIANLGVARR
jgi:SAM-dependent methyltransferase